MELTIGVAIIANDCLPQLQLLLPQLANFDQVVVGWNGSDPEVKKYLDQLCTPQKSPYEYFQFEWRPSPEEHGINEWGFCYARNLTFKRIKTTHVLWLDTDDLIGFVRDSKDVIVSAEQAYRAFKKIATEAPDDIDVWFSQYVYSRDQYNNPNVVHARERLLKNPSMWTWVYPIHEVLIPDRQPKHVNIADVQIVHYPPQKTETSAERNLRMLFEWEEQLEGEEGYEHDLGRARLYIGDTYWALEHWKLAANKLFEFISRHPKSLDIEKWSAWCFIARCQIELNNFEAARWAALNAIDIEPGLSDGYILLAQVKLLTEEDPQDVLLCIDHAGHAEEPPIQVIQNPLDYTYTPYCIVSKCKYQLGQYDAALEWALKALKLAPSDRRGEELRAQAAAKVRERDAVEATKALYQFYRDYDENEKADKLFDLLPYVAQRNDEVHTLAVEARSRVKHLYDRDTYVKLYQENDHWIPAREEIVDYGLPTERLTYMLERLSQALPNGGRILDVGCSDGYYSLMLAKEGYEVLGLDLDKRCVDLANKRAESRNLPAKFVHGFFEEMNPETALDPFDDQPWVQHFDAVICAEVIEHVQDPAFLMGALIDCAKPGSPVIITTPDEAFEKGDLVGEGSFHKDLGLTEHVRVFTQESFEALLKSDTEIDVSEAHFLPYSGAYRGHQGWQVGEIRRRPRPDGPIIRIFSGEMAEHSPNDLETGIGGSEVALIQMAKYWAGLGCQVVVYGGIQGIFDGVFYRHHSLFSPEHRSDIFISWRTLTVFEKCRPNATTTVLWNHDLYYPIRWKGFRVNEIPQEWVDRIDVSVVLSEFHKDFLSKVHSNLAPKMWVSRNGIEPSRYNKKNVTKVPHRYFYSSSFDRGLGELLEVWPEIKQAIPDAELHVCYGLETAEKILKITGEKEKLAYLYKLAASMRDMDGVVYHDKIGQRELAELQLSCEAWLYPPQPNYEGGEGGFLETYCITALEAQAARCVPISRWNGALPTTLHEAVIWDEKRDIVETLKNLPSEVLDENQKWALSQSWESLAEEWLVRLAPKEVLNDNDITRS